MWLPTRKWLIYRTEGPWWQASTTILTLNRSFSDAHKQYLENIASDGSWIKCLFIITFSHVIMFLFSTVRVVSATLYLINGSILRASYSQPSGHSFYSVKPFPKVPWVHLARSRLPFYSFMLSDVTPPLKTVWVVRKKIIFYQLDTLAKSLQSRKASAFSLK